MSNAATAREARALLHAQIDELQCELTECRSTRQLRVIEGAIRSRKNLLAAVSQ